MGEHELGVQQTEGHLINIHHSSLYKWKAILNDVLVTIRAYMYTHMHTQILINIVIIIMQNNSTSGINKLY